MLQIALYQPEIAQNTGTLLRTYACLGLHLHIIRPCGYPLSDAKLRRSAMDYMDQVHFTLHDAWDDFLVAMRGQNKTLVLATPAASHSFLQFSFQENHVLLLGRESDGVPATVRDACPESLCIPMKPTMRSLNVAISGAMIATEALRQLKGFPLLS